MTKFQVGDKVRWGWAEKRKSIAYPVYIVTRYVGTFKDQYNEDLELYEGIEDVNELKGKGTYPITFEQIEGYDFNLVDKCSVEELYIIINFYNDLIKYYVGVKESVEKQLTEQELINLYLK